MATDAAILTAARNLSTAIAAVNEADEVVKRLSEEHRKACITADEKRKHARECEQRLVQLSAQKPSEPPPKPAEKAGEGKLPSPEPLEYVQALPTPEKSTVSVPLANTAPVPNLSRKR